MIAHRIETTIDQDGTITLEDLPFQAGESVEIIILAIHKPVKEKNILYITHQYSMKIQ